MILQRNLDGAERALQEYIDIFGKDNFFLEMQNHDLEEERTVNRQLHIFAEKYGVKLVVTNDIHYVKREDASAQALRETGGCFRPGCAALHPDQ